MEDCEDLDDLELTLESLKTNCEKDFARELTNLDDLDGSNRLRWLVEDV